MKKTILIISLLTICLAFSSCKTKELVSKTSSLAESSSVQSQIVSGEQVSSDSTSSAAHSSGSKSPAVSPSSSKPAASSQASSAIPAKVAVNVTIPEGFNVSQIAQRLQDNEVCTKADFLSAVTSYNYSSYSVANSINNVSERYYKLEGYLYPSTYQFYKNSKPSDVISKILATEQSKVGSKYSYPGMTTDQIITLASVIQKEVAKYDDMVNVSAVIHNRLNIKMILQVDCTTVYLNNFFPAGLIDKYKYFYSTKPGRSAGLPVGPICSPGTSALKAAVSPSATDYLYFRSDSAGNYSFSKTQIAASSSSPVS
jgi:UPF0755 protein